ncbi:alpha/beta fold hydrolase [Streptomyces sp. NPDC093984]|uniref:alpha/beta fold hydrolase n=1 Tax=Streptomyces sp. NPDC093984 TaxID=3366052 RepID=UPI00382AE835
MPTCHTSARYPVSGANGDATYGRRNRSRPHGGWPAPGTSPTRTTVLPHSRDGPHPDPGSGPPTSAVYRHSPLPLPESGVHPSRPKGGRFPGSALGEALRSVPVTNADGSQGTDLYIQNDKFRHQFAADVPRNKTDLMALTQRPVTSAALAEGAAEPAWKTIPSWALVATQDLNIPPAAEEFMAKRAGAHTTEVRASHAVSVSRPGKVTDVIEDAARSVR